MKQNVSQLRRESKSKLSLFLRSIWLLIALLTCMSGLTYSQLVSRDINRYPAGTVFPPSFPGRIILPFIRLSTPTDYTIPLTVKAFTSISITNVTGGCDSVSLHHTISNTDTIVHILVTKKCTGSSGNYLDFRFNILNGAATDAQNFRVPIIRDSVKVVLTLDISGSMALAVQGGTTTRIQALKDAVNLLVPNLVAFRQDGDSLGLTYYSSMVYQPNTTDFPKSFIGFVGSSTAVSNDLNPRTPMQMTAMASGLMDAKNKLLLYKNKTPNTRRMAFLFTDGLQNYGPLVNVDGNNLSNGVDKLNDLFPFSKDSIKYYTIATWEAGLAPEILNTIAEASGGEALHVVQTNPTLDEWFTTQLCNMLSEGSPQMVLRKSGSRIAEPVVYSFNLNENVTKLLVEYIGKLGNDVRVKVIKDGVDITSKAIINQYSGNRFFTFNFPIQGDPKIKSGGKWDVELTGPSDSPHNIIVLADDHHFDYECKLNQKIFTVGDTIHFSTKLKYADSTLSGGVHSVKAILLKPGDDVGHLLSTFQTPTMGSNADSLAGAAYKFHLLMANDTAFYNALLAQEQNVTLTDLGNGNFKGSYTNTNLAGIYNVIFLINGELTNIGKIERTTLLSSVFKFGNLVVETPQVVSSTTSSSTANPSTGTTGQSGGKKKDIVVKIKPKNKFGKYMGPGFAPVIKAVVNPSSKKKEPITTKAKVDVDISLPFVKGIHDNLDGSYNITIANIASGTNPSISISVRDEVFYQGKVCPVPFWLYILLALLILLLILIKYYKSQNAKIYNILSILLVVLVLLIIALQYTGLFILTC